MNPLALTYAVQRQTLKVTERERKRSNVKVDRLRVLQRDVDGGEHDRRLTQHQRQMLQLPQLRQTTLPKRRLSLREVLRNVGVVVLENAVELPLQLRFLDVGNHGGRPAVEEENGRPP